MTTVNGGYTTGAGGDEAELRRRNVTSYENANGSHIYKVEAEDTKKLQKVSDIYVLDMQHLTKTSA